MKIIKLITQLENELKVAKEVCIASAIVSDNGLEFLLKNISYECSVKLLIGIDLSTPASVFKKLLELKNYNIEAKVFIKQKFFHPKLYLVKGSSHTVFIGSGNFTEGGIENNIELFHKIIDETDFSDYYNWFNTYFNLGTDLTEEWLEKYTLFNEKRKNQDTLNRRNVEEFKKSLSGERIVTELTDIDFTNQFFKLKHHLAFEGNKPKDRTPEINAERYEVKDRLMELHELVYPLIKAKGWDLHPHSMEQHIVSSYQHGEHTGDSLNSIWLHYGRSQIELDKFKEIYGENQSSLFHMRLQVLIHHEDISIWLRVGKNKGSIVERETFKDRMKEQPYCDKFFQLISALPDDFSIVINDEWKGVKSFNSSKDLHDFVKEDDINNHYFIIGKDYLPDAIEMSENNITKTVVSDFEKMLPIYKHIKIIL